MLRVLVRSHEHRVRLLLQACLELGQSLAHRLDLYSFLILITQFSHASEANCAALHVQLFVDGPGAGAAPGELPLAHELWVHTCRLQRTDAALEA